ncbi:Arfaptin-like domain protein [Teladorsagia circumcincta]|uniref:Arfaptin-like domain protein n=1 Tax=Teladorsagia circumcincta TaxID=45464 RepID=A0A2G9UBV5_TELCI|nr:Arfaptin-like domain protein [Teladorsagia circumcincta]
MMIALGRALMFSSHQRAAVRVPLLRFYQELHVFTDRAISDCAQTVEAVERARLEYRGSLLWMKKTSEEVDLLSASRSNLLSHLLGKYLDMLCAFYERTCRAYSALSANLSTFQHYEFEILTDLIEPSKKVARKVRQESLDKEAREAEYSRVANEPESEEPVENLLNFDDEPEGSLKKYLFGRESPVEAKVEETDEERPESPLGLADFESEPDGSDTPQTNKVGSFVIMVFLIF